MLTTGQAAKLCGVKADTILKWIHGGRLQASRTLGGHFRIESSQLDALKPGVPEETLPAATSPTEPRLLRCWDYMACGGAIPEDCLRCVAYRLRAAWCFEVRKLGCDVGQASFYCHTSCRDCLYFHRVARLTTDVLVVTVDLDLVQALNADRRQLRIQVARNGYEASALIASFRPTFAVIDQEVLGGGCGLLDSLHTDPRAAGLRIILTESPRKLTSRLRTHPGIVAVLRKPFGPDEILRIIQRDRMEFLPSAPLSPETAEVGT